MNRYHTSITHSVMFSTAQVLTQCKTRVTGVWLNVHTSVLASNEHDKLEVVDVGTTVKGNICVLTSENEFAKVSNTHGYIHGATAEPNTETR